MLVYVQSFVGSLLYDSHRASSLASSSAEFLRADTEPASPDMIPAKNTNKVW